MYDKRDIEILLLVTEAKSESVKLFDINVDKRLLLNIPDSTLLERPDTVTFPTAVKLVKLRLSEKVT